MSDTQFFADQLEQLDLALDQLALRDRNFDRFGIMLIDNVAELALHRHAEALNSKQSSRDRENASLIAAAVGQRFDPKVKLAKVTGLLTDALADSLLNLHAFRNTAYHAGRRHEGILHSLALYHLRCNCALLLNFKTFGWSSSSADVIPHRALKYLGSPAATPFRGYTREMFRAAWERVDAVAASMGDTLVADLHEDMSATLAYIDKALQFIADNSPDKLTRVTAVAHTQATFFAWTDEGKAYARTHMPPEVKTVADYFNWFATNYPWKVTGDPIPSWRKRLASLAAEKDRSAALKKYCDFMAQTAEVREAIDRSAAGLSEYIDSDGFTK